MCLSTESPPTSHSTCHSILLKISPQSVSASRPARAAFLAPPTSNLLPMPCARSSRPIPHHHHSQRCPRHHAHHVYLVHRPSRFPVAQRVASKYRRKFP